MQQLPPPGPPRLGAGARVGAAALVLGGVALGSVLAFYGVGALLDLLLDQGAVSCGEQVGCGIGTGFLMVLAAAGGWVVGLVVAVVLAPSLPARWSTRRALATAGWAAGAVVLLTALAMMGVVVADAGNVTPR